jgi:uncharacterized coiled-coil DUF342 family protein
MLQPSKIIRSRNEWKDKAVQRANQIREYKKSKKCYQKKIAQLKGKIKSIEQREKKEQTARCNSF